MTYTSLLTYIDGDPTSAHRLDAAIDVARQFGAHLSVMAVGYDFNVAAYSFPATSGAVVADLIVQAKDDSQDRADQARAAIAKAGILGDAEPVLCRPSMLSREIAARARFADLTVLTRPYGDDLAETASDAFEGALLESGVPVLVCPPGVHAPDASTVLIGWNYSQQALGAVRGALPYLRRAETVEIVMIDSHPPHASPGQRLATMLSRHGVTSDLLLQPPTAEPVGADLMRRAEELGAGLIVLGGFGHSRLREYFTGGATRDIVSSSAVPVLMGH